MLTRAGYHSRLTSYCGSLIAINDRSTWRNSSVQILHSSFQLCWRSLEPIRKMIIFLLLCIFSAVQCFPSSKPYWMKSAEPNSEDRWLGLRIGGGREGKLTSWGEFVPDKYGGHIVAGRLGHESDYRVNVGGSVLGNDLDTELGVMKHVQVGGSAGDTYDEKGHVYHAEAGGSLGGTLLGAAGYRRGEKGLAAGGKITGGLTGNAGTELRRKYDGGIEGKSEISSSAKLGTSFDFRPFGR